MITIELLSTLWMWTADTNSVGIHDTMSHRSRRWTSMVNLFGTNYFCTALVSPNVIFDGVDVHRPILNLSIEKSVKMFTCFKVMIFLKCAWALYGVDFFFEAEFLIDLCIVSENLGLSIFIDQDGNVDIRLVIRVRNKSIYVRCSPNRTTPGVNALYGYSYKLSNYSLSSNMCKAGLLNASNNLWWFLR